jgi:hypothetical protein
MYLQFPYCWNIALIIQRGARPGGVQQWRGAPTSGSSHGASEGGCWRSGGTSRECGIRPQAKNMLVPVAKSSGIMHGNYQRHNGSSMSVVAPVPASLPPLPWPPLLASSAIAVQRPHLRAKIPASHPRSAPLPLWNYEQAAYLPPTPLCEALPLCLAPTRA